MRVIVIGAHPDDCEFFAGGSALLWRRRGDDVRFVSVTNGDAGHFSMESSALAARRREEADRVAALADIEYEILATRDGQLEPTLARREQIIRLLRNYKPDLVLTHRPNDYHPDHRYTATLVQDAAYTVTVPLICPDTPHLEKNPVIGYLWDQFRKPIPFSADVVVDVDSVQDEKFAMLDAHVSQFYEWLPYNEGTLDEVPEGAEARLEWLKGRWASTMETVAVEHRGALVARYGDERARGVRFAEAFEISEYGGRPEPEGLSRLFPVDP